MGVNHSYMLYFQRKDLWHAMDGLLTMAFEVLSDPRRLKAIPAERMLAITREIGALQDGEDRYRLSQEALRQAEQNWGAAVVAKDYATLEQIYGDGLLYAHSDGRIESKAQYLEQLKTGSTRYDVIDHEAMDIRVYGDAALVPTGAMSPLVSAAWMFR